MDGIGFLKIIEVLSQFGLPGVLLVIWFYSDRARDRQLNAYRDDMTRVLGGYKNDMGEIRRMYESNVALVKAYESIARDLKDVVILNTRATTRLDEGMRSNLWCPVSREQTNPKEVGKS